MRTALVLAAIVSAGCASQEETLGAIQQRAIAECEASSRGDGFAACYKAYVEEHQAQPRKPTPQRDYDFLRDRGPRTR